LKARDSKTLIAATIAVAWIMLPNIIGYPGSAVIVVTDLKRNGK